MAYLKNNVRAICRELFKGKNTHGGSIKVIGNGKSYGTRKLRLKKHECCGKIFLGSRAWQSHRAHHNKKERIGGLN